MELDNIPGNIKTWWRLITVFVLLILFIAFWKIKFTKQVSVEIIIEDVQHVSELTSKSNGTLVLVVRNGQLVKTGELLGYIIDDYSIRDVLYLGRLVDKLGETFLDPGFSEALFINQDSIQHMTLQRNLNVGPLSNQYEVFASAFETSKVQKTESRHSLERLTTNFESLRKAFRVFENRFLVKSTRYGRVSFAPATQDQWNVKTNETIIFISDSSSRLIGKIKLPISGSADVRQGQTVIISLQNFTSRESRNIIGHVAAIAPFTEGKTAYLAVVDIEAKDKASVLSPLREYHGKAEIIIGEETIFDRLFNKSNP